MNLGVVQTARHALGTLSAMLVLAVIHVGLPLHLALFEHQPISHEHKCELKPGACSPTKPECLCGPPAEIHETGSHTTHCGHLPHDSHEHRISSFTAGTKKIQVETCLLSLPVLVQVFDDSRLPVSLQSELPLDPGFRSACPPRGPPFV